MTEDSFSQSFEFENGSTSVKGQKEAGCQVSATVNLDASSVQKERQKAIKKINKEVNVPGFRRGKAPQALILEKYASYVDQELRELVLNKSLKDTIELSNYHPFDRDAIKKASITTLSPEEGAVVELKFESKPEVPEINTSLQLKSPEKKSISEEEISKAIEDLQHIYANYEPVSDRGVEMGDFVRLDITGLDPDGDEERNHTFASDQRFEVSEEKISKWLVSALLGKSTGDTFEAESVYEGDSEEEAENFKPTNCLVKVCAIEKSAFPDEETLAREMTLESPEKLREKIVTDLETRLLQDQKLLLKKQSRDQLLELYHFDLPKSLLESEQKHRLQSHLTLCQQQKMPAEEIEKKKPEIEEIAQKEAEETLRMHFLSQEIARAHQIHVTQSDLELEFRRQNWVVPPEERIIHNEMSPEELRSTLFLHVLTEKVEDYLVDKAEIVTES